MHQYASGKTPGFLMPVAGKGEGRVVMGVTDTGVLVRFQLDHPDILNRLKQGESIRDILKEIQNAEFE